MVRGGRAVLRQSRSRAAPARTWPKQILVVGAHYDTVRGSPGADDNASGVAALLEISRLFAVVVPRVAVRFVAFVNEEAPFFLSGQQGSMIYARRARAQNDDIRLMLSLEMLGYYSAEPGSQRYPPLFRLLSRMPAQTKLRRQSQPI
jgi:Zn-dependent M28 family amino/carboxypeptidase